MKDYSTLIRQAYETPWAILESKLAEITQLLQAKGEGLEIEFEAAREKSSQEPDSFRRFGSTAIVGLQGTIFPKANLFTEISGGTSAQMFRRDLGEAVKDKQVKSIILDVDSPGGSVLGIAEAGQAVKAANDFKPVIASVNSGIGASAAYWIISQAGRIEAGPSTAVGAIGVRMLHQDVSKAERAEGVKTTVLSSGKNKSLGHPYEPLTKEAKAHFQAELDKIHSKFIQAVAQGRGVSEETVRNRFGQGAMVQADDALEVGMIDAISDFDSTLHGVEQANIAAARVGQIQTKREYERFLRESGFSKEESVWLARAWDDHRRESGGLDPAVKALLDKHFQGAISRMEV
jgi:signal peptide peptidase SppA